MNKFTQLLPFVQDLFDDLAVAWKAARIVAGILKARSPGLSEISREMVGNEAANYKCIQRFLETNDPREVLVRLFREEASFVIGDPTWMLRPLRPLGGWYASRCRRCGGLWRLMSPK